MRCTVDHRGDGLFYRGQFSLFLEIIESTAGEGVTMADLALVLDLPLQQVQPLIEDLQLQGLIYQNGAGSFVPL